MSITWATGDLLAADADALVNAVNTVGVMGKGLALAFKRQFPANEDVEAGLVAFVAELRRLKVRSVAIPALGCGLGGLDWADVKPRIEKALAEVPDVRALVFAPQA